jgi:multidrug efflux pump subunit AcrA (membrane-fusion protein)
MTLPLARPLLRAGAAALLTASLALLASCSGSNANDPPAQKPASSSARGSTPVGARKVPVVVETVSVHPVTYPIQAVGSLLAEEIVRVPARVRGVVDQIAFNEGRSVGPGTVLARIDIERYRLALARSEANWQQAEAQTRQVEAALDKRRALRAKDPGWVSEEELSNFTAQLDQAKAAASSCAGRVRAGEEGRGGLGGPCRGLGHHQREARGHRPVRDGRNAHRDHRGHEAAQARVQGGADGIREARRDSPITFRVQAVPGR